MAYNYLTAEQAAELIQDGDNLGFSGFTHAGCPKVVSKAIAAKAVKEHEAGRPFKVGVFTGASTGDRIDGELTRAKAIKVRYPYQTNKDMRNAINANDLSYADLHLSIEAQEIRYGFFGKLNYAIVEAADVTDDGHIVPTTAVGILPTICSQAEKIIVELNDRHPKEIRGIHDICEPEDPPCRKPIAITNVRDRVGKPYVEVDPAKIVAVVKTSEPNDDGGFAPLDDVTLAIGANVAKFLVGEMKAGRIPASFLPIQSGVGNVANAVLGAMGDNPDIPAFEVYTEVIQDAVIGLMRKGKIKFASGCSLTVSREMILEIYKDLDFFKDKLVLRPQEYSNNPEVVRRLGIISINTAIEADIFGNINSTHVMGTKMMNGIGGSGDFTRAAYISIFTTPSTAKDGAISAFVPFVSHVDHNEHSVKIIISEYGIADLRGKSPRERAECIIENCVHPDYKASLREYLNLGVKGHTPHHLGACYAFHRQFLETGSMKGVDFSEYKK